jgi:methylenetetrahydrofolate--tRNA-(uracil-5-)-methyltransferase
LPPLPPTVQVVGGGLAGCEAAYQLLSRGIPVTLHEMRPRTMTAAHSGERLAELVCSNSLRSEAPESAPGILKAELQRLDSLLLRAALAAKVPAGSALAVDRALFSDFVEQALGAFEGFTLLREEVTALPEAGPVLLAPGPLASPALLGALGGLLDDTELFFFDAIAPIVDASSLDLERLFFASRYNKGDPDDYLNAPMDRTTFEAFYKALVEADRAAVADFDADRHLPTFQGCQPIEIIAKGGPLALAFGPMKPVGIYDANGKRPFAVVQLRAENLQKTAFNLVGFQTRLRIPEQERVFRMIPGLEQARFLRFGSIHRNTFINSPKVLDQFLRFRANPRISAAGQFTGSEGYTEACAMGLLAGLFLADELLRPPAASPLPPPPPETALGCLHRHVTASPSRPFQPSNVHFGLLPPGSAHGRKDRRRETAAQAATALSPWIDSVVSRLGRPR